MAYVEVYFAQWDDKGDTTHEIKLLQEGGSGTTEIVSFLPATCSIKRRGNKNYQLDKHIYGSELTFNFFVASANIATFDAIFQSDYQEWKIEHYYDSSLDWVGWLQPANYSRKFIKEGDYYALSLSAVDGLAYLKNLEFVDASTGAQFTDRVSIMATLKRALENTGLSLDFRVHLGTWCTNVGGAMTATDCALDKVDCDNSRFTKVKDGREINEDCYTIIEKLLAPFNCYLIQFNGQYWIVNPQEKDSYYFTIPWTTLTVGARTAQDLTVTPASDVYKTKGTLQKLRPFETVEITFRDRNVSDNLLSNGDFSSGTTGWNKTGYFGSLTASSGYGEVPAVFSIDGSPTYIYTDDESITQNSIDDQLQVTFKARITSYVGTGGNEPLMKMELYQGANFVPVKSNNVFPMYESSQFTSFTVLFDLPATETDYQLRLYTYPRSTGNYTSFNFEFDDFVWVPIYADGEDLTFDKFYGINNTDDVYTDVFDRDLFFGDSAQDNDIGSFQIGGTRTSTWNRYGKSEDASIQVLHGQNIIENFGDFKNYLRVKIIDSAHTILAYSLITIDGKDYQILSGSEIFAGDSRKELDLQVAEVLNAAVNTSLTSQALTSVDGVSTQSTEVSGTGSGVSIDDSVESTSSTWSSSKINTSLESQDTLQEITDNGSSTTNQISITTTATALRVLDGVADGVVFKADANGGHVIGYDGSAYNELVLRTAASLSNGITILANGDVGLNDSTPTFKIDVNGTGRFVQDLTTDADMTANSFATTNVDIETGGSYIIDATGTISATSLRATSDITKKKDLIKITGALDVIDKLNGYYFTWKDSNQKDLGLIAQMVKPVLPQTVSVDESGKHSLNYNSFIALLIEGIKEVNSLVIRLFKQLNRRIDKLEKEIEKK